MEQLGSPSTLHYYNSFLQYKKYLDAFIPQLTLPTLQIASKPSLFNGISPELLPLGYSGWSISVFDTPEKSLMMTIAVLALAKTGICKYRNPSSSFWKTLFVKELPINASYYLPALVVKQAFFLKTGRSSVDHTKREERIAYIVMTTAFSVLVFPRLYAKLTGNITPISNRGLAKYFVIQSVWHLAIDESMAFVAKECRKNIRTDPEEWLVCVLDPDYNMSDPGYGLTRTLVKSLKAEHPPRDLNVSLKQFYLSFKPYFETENKNQTGDDETQSTFAALQAKVKQRYPFLFLTPDQIRSLKTSDILIDEDNEVLWISFYEEHKHQLSRGASEYLDTVKTTYNRKKLFGV